MSHGERASVKANRDKALNRGLNRAVKKSRRKAARRKVRVDVSLALYAVSEDLGVNVL